ncbi:MAG: Sec-independent protein translocase protein TatB [Burkholderiales bacterium]
MFGIGFSELVVILIVVLLVVGPQRLPGAARSIGLVVGRVQRYATQVRNEIRREIALDDMRQFEDEVKRTVHGAETAANRGIEEAFTIDDFQRSGGPQTAPPPAETPRHSS